MPTDFAFRFATYLTLFLASMCAGYSEWDFLKEVSFFTVIVGLLMFVAFYCDGRGFSMSLGNANILGGGIVLMTVLWFGLHYRNPESLMNTLPWPAGGLPYLVALLMVLVPAKLFRPKHVGDWWALQGLGLSMVAVGGAMTDDALYMVLMALYAIVGVWSLTLFYIRRVSGHVPPPPPFQPVRGLRALFSPQTYLPAWFFVARSRPTVAEPFAGLGQPTPTERLGRSHFFRSVRWVVVAILITLPLFFLTPRTDGLRWELFSPRMETGITKSTVDLSRTGELMPNPKPAFSVKVTNPDGSPGQIPEDKRFRVSSHSSYFYPKGMWNRTGLGHLYPIPPEGRGVWPPVNEVQPQIFGPDAIVLEFELEPDTFGTPFADPVYHIPGQPAPIFYIRDNRYEFATALNNGAFRIPNYDATDGGRVSHYWQHHRMISTLPSARWRLHDLDFSAAKARIPLLDQPSKRIATEAKRLLDRLIRDGKIPRKIRERANPATLLPAPEDHLVVALAFEQYFSTSKEFEYTLSLKRIDRSIDPIEDFLFNTKAGHCERFASALTLILRSLGIPAQFVVGYRGCEKLEDGLYQVRNEHAHAWVEVLISDRVPGTNLRDWYWLTVDPTTLTGEVVSPATASTTGSRFINAFITGLTPERQKQIVSDLGEFGSRNLAPLLVTFFLFAGVVLIAVLIYFRLKKPVKSPALPDVDPVPWFSRMAKILERGGFFWQNGQTPAEFAQAASNWLASRSDLQDVASIPENLANQLDRMRYAGVALTPSELDAMRVELDRLDQSIPKIRQVMT